jgi:cytosine/adenosine deaminase-related metal-dependent hydrolase
VWLSEDEEGLLAKTGTKLLHCPSSNLKLASGIARVPELMERGVQVSLGADGAPCNNNLDGFLEMRLCALLHKPRLGPKTLPAHQVVRMATLGGAQALGMDADIGSLEVGKKADVIVVDTQRAHIAPTESPYSAVVYACRSTDVRHVLVDGQVLVQSGELSTLDPRRAIAEARASARRIFDRI